ncbi:MULTISPECIES: hypothetical protein [Microtetraspora]|uniref:Uncharacterized protein n=1 Tax=Microtetraspora glauca TaxID=1996 RepID=A0ABV3GDA0_MICGL|nr:hypothetical protein [Microtetraspora sp. AC03309]MCC5574934.1 hypothetical protein [Microtetraspora sp. AC03309]
MKLRLWIVLGVATFVGMVIGFLSPSRSDRHDVGRWAAYRAGRRTAFGQNPAVTLVNSQSA